MIDRTVRTASLLTALALVAGAEGVVAQTALPASDVELLGERYGTSPPDGFRAFLRQNPDAFAFGRAWFRRNPSLRMTEPGTATEQPRFEVVVGPADGPLGAMSSLGPREGTVSGTIRVPVVLGLFADSPDDPPFTRARIQEEFFDGPNTRNGTVTEYYAEISGGLLELLGETLPWRRSELTAAEVSGGESGLRPPARVGLFIMELLAAQEGVDWGRFDNDGPDGVPNSGDDDGFVDVLAVMHPQQGAECGGVGMQNRIWSHKFNLVSSVGQAFVTGTPSASGGNIRVSDYTVQPVFACPVAGNEPPVEINEIGVLAHELGHGLGLPDLYDTSLRHRGIGAWGLMGSGSWGCDQSAGITPERPCHMSAWSKEQLGWVDVVTLAPGQDLGTVTFEPVETAERVYRFDAGDGSGEYFLVENRQPIDFDANLPTAGLAIWHVDPGRLGSSWTSNTVNVDPDRLGVRLVQADGRGDLQKPRREGGNRGDSGDLFPGSTGAREFHAGSDPVARTNAGGVSGLTLTGIGLAGSDATASALTRFQTVSVRAVGAGDEVAFGVDGAPVSGDAFTSAPFEVREVEAGLGSEIEEGVRVGFLAWSDDPAAPRVRSFVTPPEDATLTAEYGGREVRLRVDREGDAFDVAAGSVEVDPSGDLVGDELWFEEGVPVRLEAVASTGFGFDGWTGDLAGESNPVTVTMDGPVDATASFELIYGIPEDRTVAVDGARPVEIVLVAENANDPVTWSLDGGELPLGLSFAGTGTIAGTPLEGGAFTVTLSAVDDVGLTATGALTLDVGVPSIEVDRLLQPLLLTPGPGLTSDEAFFLDDVGNGNGIYDLGDFRSLLLADPGLAASVSASAPARVVVPIFRLGPDRSEAVPGARTSPGAGSRSSAGSAEGGGR